MSEYTNVWKKSSNYRDESWSIGNGYCNVFDLRITGTVKTYHGIVEYYYNRDSLHLYYVSNGILYARYWQLSFAKRTVVRLAKEFSNEKSANAGR